MRLKLLLLAVTLISSVAQSEVTFNVEKITDNLHVLYGRGGNIAISTGGDGIYIVDDQFANLSEQIKKKISALQPGSAEFIINTHYHKDHTGGNENFAKDGGHIIAHHNVHKRLKVEHGSNSKHLPVLTFGHDMALHFNAEKAEIRHFAHAHTDGDSVIYFNNANVVHMGDLYFNLGGLPFVDVQGGGSLSGLISAIEQVISDIDGQTKVIPGHGPLSDRDGLKIYLALLKKARTLMTAAMDGKKSLESVQKLDPLGPLNLKYANWLPKERVVKLFYLSLKGESKSD